MRKLASIQKITALEQIEGADRIETASILGWKVVVRKDEGFKAGDLVVFCEIDTVLQNLPDKLKELEGMRVRTMRFKGQISQGICFPLNEFGDVFMSAESPLLNEGNDVTEILGFKKYEEKIPTCLSGIKKGDFPSFIPKTDETRVQGLKRLLHKYGGGVFSVTEKIDGASSTFYVKDGEFGVCSRNMELEESDAPLQWRLAKKLNLKEKMLSIGDDMSLSCMSKNFAIQCELAGEGIQSNRLGIKGHELFVFNVFDIDKNKYLSLLDCGDPYCEIYKMVTQKLSLKTVPIVFTNYILTNDVDELVKLATRKSCLNPKVWAEGVVIRKLHDTNDPEMIGFTNSSGRLSFKVMNPEYLIKYSL